MKLYVYIFLNAFAQVRQLTFRGKWQSRHVIIEIKAIHKQNGFFT